MDNLIGQLVIVIAVVLIVPEIFKKFNISAFKVTLYAIGAAFVYALANGGMQTIVASIIGG